MPAETDSTRRFNIACHDIRTPGAGRGPLAAQWQESDYNDRFTKQELH